MTPECRAELVDAVAADMCTRKTPCYSCRRDARLAVDTPTIAALVAVVERLETGGSACRYILTADDGTAHCGLAEERGAEVVAALEGRR